MKENFNNHYFIVVLNWNGWSDTQKCIESIISKNISNNYSLILVDNGSESTELYKIEQYLVEKFKYCCLDDRESLLIDNKKLFDFFDTGRSCERILLIKNNENLGFAGGNNAALRILDQIGCKYVLLLNNDTEVEDNALDKLYNFVLENRNVGAVVPQIRFFNPSDVIWNCGGMINFLGIRKYDYANYNISNVPQTGSKQIDYGTGCALLINLPLTGILSEKYFFGEEDMEFAFRLRNRKIPVYCNYDSIVYHKVGASRNLISEKRIGKMVYHYCQRISNLKDNLNPVLFFFSVIAHMVSSMRLLNNMKSLKPNVFINCWKTILNNRNNKKFTLKDFKTISNSDY